jgi:1-acyl-sn-glycerol-3-phosphate acyltransferase
MKKSLKNIPYRISCSLFELFFRTILKVKFIGRENIPEPPYIIVANHASLADPPLVGAACKKHPVDFMAKSELFNIPVVGIWTRAVGCIPVKRGHGASGSLKEALKRVKEKRVVAVFPEGTRSEDGSLQEAKRGTGFLIAKAKVPVLPIYIDGSAKAFPKGGPIRMGSRVNVIIGKPIQPSELSDPSDPARVDFAGVAGMIMDRIAALKKAS